MCRGAILGMRTMKSPRQLSVGQWNRTSKPKVYCFEAHPFKRLREGVYILSKLTWNRTDTEVRRFKIDLTSQEGSVMGTAHVANP